eukprot:TCALIF_01515-PA protein Name:"Protein of unknown function" AED:0.00 eAED:0.00 QI:96/1/1/1/0.5/0.33/3/18/214
MLFSSIESELKSNTRSSSTALSSISFTNWMPRQLGSHVSAMQRRFLDPVSSPSSQFKFGAKTMPSTRGALTLLKNEPNQDEKRQLTDHEPDLEMGMVCPIEPQNGQRQSRHEEDKPLHAVKNTLVEIKDTSLEASQPSEKQNVVSKALKADNDEEKEVLLRAHIDPQVKSPASSPRKIKDRPLSSVTDYSASIKTFHTIQSSTVNEKYDIPNAK